MASIYFDSGQDFSGVAATVTAIASPGVVAWTAHTLLVGAPVVFRTTGALPTGITAGTVYYVIAAGFGANSFQISATIGGAAINFTGSTSGTHTVMPGLNSGTSDNLAADLSNTSDATVVAIPTFTTAGTNNLTITAHGVLAGTGVEFSTTGTLPTGLVVNTRYYLGVTDANTVTVHTNVADAEAGTNAVTITAASGSGTHTANNYTVTLAGAQNLSGVNGTHCRVTTTGTSHVFTMTGGPHGFTSGDEVFFEISTGGTIFVTTSVAVAVGNRVYVNALSTTTFRIYSTSALAVSGGASDYNVTTAEVRTLHVRGSKQASINLCSSTVTNRRIFWVQATSDTNNLVIVDAAGITGVAGSTWAIGGRGGPGGWNDVLQSARNGDTVYCNTDLTTAHTGNLRNPGLGTAGWLKIVGVGSRRVLSTINASIGLLTPAASVSMNFAVDNLELQGVGSGGVISGTPTRYYFNNMRITDGTGPGISVFSAGLVFNCEISGCSTSGWTGNTAALVFDSYFHDNGTGMTPTTGGMVIVNCVIERNAAHGVFYNTAAMTPNYLYGNTIYRNGNSGFEQAATVPSTTNFSWILMARNILKDNGDAAGEYNIELPPLSQITPLGYGNDVTVAGSLGGANLLNWTLFASDITTDPLFVDPDAAAGSRNFGLQSTSPAKALGQYTYLNSLSISYADAGAVQRQEAAGGGGPLVGGRLVR